METTDRRWASERAYTKQKTPPFTQETTMIELGVNIDHIATLRNARKAVEPDPVAAVVAAELGGADGITVHLREDRRHIHDDDLRRLKETVRGKLNLEMSMNPEIVNIACKVVPDQATLVLEKRREVTTEGGLDVVLEQDRVADTIGRLHERGILVSLFLDPDPRQIEAAARLGSDAVEIHTGRYADAKSEAERFGELQRILKAARLIREAGMRFHAGHGLNYGNVVAVANIPGLAELNIGHGIVTRAVFVGIQTAVREMKILLAGH